MNYLAFLRCVRGLTQVSLRNAVVGALFLISVGVGTTAKAETLSSQPLSLKGGVPPTVMFALSVEFPTAITPAYQDASSYSSTGAPYLGYFDNAKCYNYDATNQYFVPNALTTTRKCTTGWSGNFLNWATMAALDEFRYAMTGGYRSTDTVSTTVLERSYQTGQGSNFLTKTFTESDGQTTPFPAGTALTIVSKGQGIAMTVAQSATSTDNFLCQSPLTFGPFGCAFTRKGTSDPGSCLTWSGSGTLASPYTCTSFSAFNGVSAVAVAPTAQAVAKVATTASTTTVTCNNPGFTNVNNANVFGCSSWTLTNGHTGSCLQWDPNGNGTAAYPYTCTQFGAFSGGEQVATVGAVTTTNQTLTYYGAQLQKTYTCTVSSAVTTCTLAGSPTATCSAYGSSSSNDGSSSSKPYICSTFSLDSGAYYVGSSATSGSTVKSPSGSSGKYYSTKYSIEYLPQQSGSIYYASTYPVAAVTSSNSVYYVTSYDASFGTAAQSYNVRVKVCDPTIGLESNCVQYGSSYKPVGVIQNNGSSMRFGVTSYFNANDIDNAVLRSKAHFTAPTQFAGTSSTSANPYAEWSSASGVFFTNPFNCADSTTTGAPINCTPDTATTNSFVGAMGRSGVINYINQFGKVSQGYKTYDNIGKLYYETLRYLRGNNSYPVTATPLGPTASFYNGAKASNADGFPVITTWDNPQKTGWSCQKNYILAMGDSHTWCDKKLPNGTYASTGSGTCNAYTDGNGNSHTVDYGSLASDSMDVTAETNLVGTTEGNNSSLATTMTGAGGASYYMAGLAAWAARSDIISGKANPSAGDPPKVSVRTYVIDVQENKDCNYLGQFWLTSKYGVPESYDSTGTWITGNGSWLKQLALGAGTCSSNGPSGYNNATGGTYTWPKQLLRGNDPAGMISSVQTAIASIAAQSGDEAALAQSSGSLDSGTGAYVYRASYNSGGWKGDVSALTIDTSGNFGTSAAWTAATMLPAPANRKFLSWNPETHQPFVFANGTGNVLPAGMSSTQQNYLNQTPAAVSDGLGAARLNYLRGDQSNEYYLPGTTSYNTGTNYGWRSRVSAVSTGTYVSTGGVLGDFIDSNPLFVGAPNLGYSFPGYKSFAIANQSRTPILYVGSNDGALHAFNADYTINSTTGIPQVVTSPVASGTEVLAYVPSAIYPNLNQLMDQNYNHNYYVDGSPVYGDVCANTCNTSSDWKSIVVGTMGAGGQSVFAIDVTTATFTTTGGAVDTSKALWEFNDSDDSDLGFTFSQPIIRKLNDGKWYVIFGNGFNNSYPDSHSSGSGRAELYLLQANGPGAGNAWVQGTNFYKIELKSPSESSVLATRLSNPNGLSSVTAVDSNGDDVTDMLYAGDRNGNLWKINLAGADPTAWGSAFKDQVSGAALPMFTAKTASNAVQQITTGASVTINPNGGYIVTFGTGSWVDNTDSFGPFSKVDSLYGIWDDMKGTQPASGTTAKILRSQLQRQGVLSYVATDANGNISGTCSPGDSNCFVVQSNCSVNYTSSVVSSSNAGALCPSTGSNILANAGSQGTQYGWVFDYGGSGERTRSAFPQVNGTNIRVQSLTPAVDPCAGNTIGLEYVLSSLTGGMPASSVYIVGSGGGPTGYQMYYNQSTGALSTTGGAGFTPVSVNLGGKTVAGGASDNPVVFNIRPPASLVPLPPGTPTPPTGPCTGIACDSLGSPYLPGWGFLMNLKGPTSSNSRYVYSCHQPEFGNGAPVCQLEHKLGRFGQINWKTINH